MSLEDHFKFCPGIARCPQFPWNTTQDEFREIEDLLWKEDSSCRIKVVSRINEIYILFANGEDRPCYCCSPNLYQKLFCLEKKYDKLQFASKERSKDLLKKS